MRRNLLILCLLLLTSFLKTVAQDSDSLVSQQLRSMSVEELMNVRIESAGKKSQEAKTIPASVVVITRQEIEKYGYQSLREILNQVPGLYLWDGYHVRGAINIGIRGYTSTDDVIILVNGVNQVEGVYNEYLLTKVAVPVEAIERIEVVRGPMSVLYGSGAFFGVINIITNQGESQPYNRAALSAGSSGMQRIALSTATSAKDIRLGVTGSLFRTNGLDVPYSSMLSTPWDTTTYGLSPSATTKGILKDRQVYFGMNGSYKGFTADFSHSEIERGGFLVQPPVQYSPTKRHSTNFMGEFKHNFGPVFQMKGKISYLSTSALSEFSLNEKNSYLSFGYYSDILEAELLGFLKPAQDMDITVGLSVQDVYYALNPAELQGAWGGPYGKHLTRLSDDSRMIENAAFFQADYFFNSIFQLVGGIRFQQMRPYTFEASGGAPYIKDGRYYYSEKYDYTRVRVIPSLALICKPGESHVIKLLYGEALRNPPLGQMADILFSTSLDGSLDFPQLRPSYIRTLELNYTGVISKAISVQTSVFYNDLTNLISQYFLDVTDSTTVYYTSNRGRIKTLGTEISLQVRPASWINVSGGLMVQKSDNATSGIEKVEVPYSPQMVGYFKTSLDLSSHISAYITGTYTGSMWPDYDYQKKMRLGLETPAYTQFDGGVFLRGLVFDGTYIHLRVTNLFNSVIYYPAMTLNSFADKGLRGFPRQFSFTLGYQF